MEGLTLLKRQKSRHFVGARINGSGYAEAEARSIPDGHPRDPRLCRYSAQNGSVRVVVAGKRHRADYRSAGRAHNLQEAASAALFPCGADAHAADGEAAGIVQNAESFDHR
jgi:hypothetical protein